MSKGHKHSEETKKKIGLANSVALKGNKIMRLSKPFVGEFRISQGFGQNFNNWYKESGQKGHSGLDFACPMRTPILSACAGKVILISEDVNRGIGVAVLSDDIFKWNGKDCKLRVLYWHLTEKSVKVKMGEQVKTGQLLALSGNTGRSTGPHLHLSTAPMSPDDSMKLLADGNGYAGYIDPLPYLDLDTTQIKRIKELQELLNKYGAKLKVDGKYGKLSEKAFNEFIGI